MKDTVINRPPSSYKVQGRIPVGKQPTLNDRLEELEVTESEYVRLLVLKDLKKN